MPWARNILKCVTKEACLRTKRNGTLLKIRYKEPLAEMCREEGRGHRKRGSECGARNTRMWNPEKTAAKRQVEGRNKGGLWRGRKRKVIG